MSKKAHPQQKHYGVANGLSRKGSTVYDRDGRAKERFPSVSAAKCFMRIGSTSKPSPQGKGARK